MNIPSEPKQNKYIARHGKNRSICPQLCGTADLEARQDWDFVVAAVASLAI